MTADDPATNTPPSGVVQLGTFAWSASGIVDPSGWPYAKRSAPTEAYGRRNIQWYERWKPGGGGILHATWPLASASASGASATWYFFRPGAVPANPPDERLRAYRWQQMGGPSTDANGTWIKYRRLP